MPPTYEGTNLNLAAQGLEGVLTKLQSSISSLVFKNLPIFGNQLNNAITVQDLWKPNSLSGTTLTLDNITQKLSEATGGQVTVLAQDANEIKFKLNLDLNKAVNAAIAANLGIPSLALQVNGNGATNLNLDLNLEFGLQKSSGFFLDTAAADELKLSLNSALSSLDASAKLGFLQVDVQNNGTQLNGNVAIDLSDRNADGQLSDSELRPTLSGSANIGLNAQTKVGNSVVLPDFNFNLGLSTANIFDSNSQPQVSFNNVNVGLNSFFTNFATPVLQSVNTVLSPIRPLLDGLTTNIDFLTNSFPSGLGARGLLDAEQTVTPGEVTVLDILSLVNTVKPISGFEQSLQFIKSVRDITQFVDTLSTTTTNGSINLGGFGFNLNAPGSPTFNHARPASDLANQLNALAPSFSNSLQTFNGLQFPILTNPQEAFNLLEQVALSGANDSSLLLQRPSNLFTYDMPALQLGLNNLFAPIPILPPLYVDIGVKTLEANMDFAFGYDTQGLSSTSANSLFNGFYVSDRANADGTGADIPEVKLLGEFGANLNLNAGIGELSVAKLSGGGYVRTTANFNLADPNGDGKVRINELQAPYFDEVSGKISAFLNAEARLPVAGAITKELLLNQAIYGINPVVGVVRNLAQVAGWLDDEFGFIGQATKKVDSFVEDIPVVGAIFKFGKKVVKTVTSLVDDPSKPSDVLFSLNSPEVTLWDYSFGTSGNNNRPANLFLIGDDNDNLLEGFAGNDEIYGRGGNDTLKGNQGRDTLYGETGNDWLYGGLGDDFLDGGEGDDQLFGDSGNDLLYGRVGNDFLFGGEGDDTLYGNEGADQLAGEAGNDILYGGEGDDTLRGGEGSDRLYGESGNDTLSGDAGADELSGGDGNDILNGGDDSDQLFGEGGDDILYGGTGDDILNGGEGNDQLFGELGNDVMEGGAGDDQLTGGDGNDRLLGNSGNDQLLGEAGDDTLYGGAGADFLNGGEGNDQLYGEDGNDVLDGFAGNDTLYGGEGADILTGGIGQDTLWGEAGNDRLYGGDDNDQILGGTGDDQLFGDAGDDDLYGEVGNDRLEGGAGSDYLNGGEGNDQLRGGMGNDLLVGGNGDDSLDGGEGNDELFGDIGNDTILGGIGDDYLVGGAGADLLQGGEGSDTASYITATSGVTASLTTGMGATGDARGDVFQSIENLEGSAYSDRLIGDAFTNILSGLGGDDFLDGREGDDILDGGEGRDRLLGSGGNDQLFGGAGDDDLDGADGNDFLSGGDGDDFLTGQAGDDRLEGGLGNDTFLGGDGDDSLLGEAGDDNLDGGNGNDVLNGGLGDDFLYGSEGDDQLLGAGGNDYLEGGAGSDRLDGGDGSDILYGQEGNDELAGGAGQDQLFGGLGNDILTGGLDHDMLSGGGGNDRFVINLGDGSDSVIDFGGIGRGIAPPADTTAEVDIIEFRGADLVAQKMLLTQKGSNLEISFEGVANTQVILKDFALENLDNLPQSRCATVNLGNILFDGQTAIQDSFDVFNAEWQYDQVLNRNTVTFLNDLNNRIQGFDNSDDVINGQGGDDMLWGLSGNDTLRGGTGNDTLFGQQGNDWLVGDQGDDLLFGGSGRNTLVGGLGKDIFALTGEGTDLVLDFTVGQDRLGLAAGLTFDQLTVTQGTGINSSSTWVKLNSTGDLLMTLNNVQASALTRDLFTSVSNYQAAPLAIG